MKYIKVSIVIVLLLLCLQIQVESAKILALCIMSTKSMQNILDSLVEVLASHGHQITVVSPFSSNQNITNIRYITGPDTPKTFQEFPNPYERRISRAPMNIFKLFPFLEDIYRSHYDMSQVQQLRHEVFDLVIVNLLMNECSYPLANYFNTSIIGISPQTSVAWISSAMGSPVPPSFVPIFLTGFSHSMSFFERIENLYTYIWSYCWRQFYYIPRIETIYKDYFPNAISINEFESTRLNIILMNSHPVLNYPRPLLPNMIEVGGMHCRNAKPLPKELEDFINESGDDGFIYFSMGSVVPGISMPTEYRNTILNTFAKLRQRVIWKWEMEKMDDLPPNVILRKWLPQQDILGHPKIRIFITHGGLLSIEEAVFHRVPLIGIPMFSDQDLNMRQAEMSGFALTQEFGEIKGDVLYLKIQKILKHSNFTEKVKHLSKIFRDDPIGPLNRAVYWVEYQLRHKNSLHLISNGRNLNFFQYHSLDIIFLLCLFMTMFLYLIYKISQRILKFSVHNFTMLLNNSKSELGLPKKKK